MNDSGFLLGEDLNCQNNFVWYHKSTIQEGSRGTRGF